MTPKEKAKELVDAFYMYGFPVQLDRLSELQYEMENAKQCSLIAINEILKVVVTYNDTQHEVNYWQQVKHEIEKL